MKRIIGIGIILLIMLVGCNDAKDDNAYAKDESIEVVNKNDEDVADEETGDQQEVSETFADREALPFDINEFNEIYTSSYENQFGNGEGTPLAIKEETIAMLNGSMDEALIILNTLNDLTEGKEISEYSERFASDLVNDSYFTDEVIVDGLEIKIVAVDISTVTISVFNGSD